MRPDPKEIAEALETIYERGGNPEWLLTADGEVVDYLGLDRSPEEVLGFDPRKYPHAASQREEEHRP